MSEKQIGGHCATNDIQRWAMYSYLLARTLYENGEEHRFVIAQQRRAADLSAWARAQYVNKPIESQ